MGRNGISIKIAGRALSFGQFEHRLHRFKAKRKADRPQLFVTYDPEDLSRVRVFDDKMRFVCEAARNQTYGRHDRNPVSEQQLKEGIAEQRRMAKLEKEVRDNRHLRFMSPWQIAADKGKTPPPTPNANAPITPRRTALDGVAQRSEVQVMSVEARARQRVFGYYMKYGTADDGRRLYDEEGELTYEQAYAKAVADIRRSDAENGVQPPKRKLDADAAMMKAYGKPVDQRGRRVARPDGNAVADLLKRYSNPEGALPDDDDRIDTKAAFDTLIRENAG